MSYLCICEWFRWLTCFRVICRFFAGFFGSCPLAVVAAVFADMYNNQKRGMDESISKILAQSNRDPALIMADGLCRLRSGAFLGNCYYG